MHAIGFTHTGGPQVFELLTLPIPKLEPYEVLVEVMAIGINPVDCKVRKHATKVSETNPIVPGYDAAGVIVAIGSDVTKFDIGDEVYYAGNLRKQGTYAPYHAIDSRVIARRPTLLSYSEAAGIPLDAISAWEALIDRMKIPEDPTENEGKTILITAGAGGIGSIAIQIAKKILGLKVIASASREDTHDWIKKCGADSVINSHNPVSDELDKVGVWQVDYILHCNEQETENFKHFRDIIKPFGVIGVVTTRVQEDEINLFNKNVKLLYEIMFEKVLNGVELERQGEILKIIANLLDQKILFTTVRETKVFNLNNVKEAHERLEKGEVIGKIVMDQVDLL